MGLIKYFQLNSIDTNTYIHTYAVLEVLVIVRYNSNCNYTCTTKPLKVEVQKYISSQSVEDYSCGNDTAGGSYHT
jgi:hypothetical protein